MKRLLIALMASLGVLCAPSLPAAAKTKLSFAFVTDPTHEMYVYALRQGMVRSDKVELELVTLAIPALVQGFLGRQYDIVETSMISIPRAVERGLNVSLLFTALGRLSPGPTLDIWVKRDSPVQSIQDLKGKKIAVFGLGSTALSMIRVALAKEHGFNVELQGGDFQFVELPTAIIPTAMERGETEAGCLLYAQVFEAQKTGNYRSIYSGVTELQQAGRRAHGAAGDRRLSRQDRQGRGGLSRVQPAARRFRALRRRAQRGGGRGRGASPPTCRPISCRTC